MTKRFRFIILSIMLLLGSMPLWAAEGAASSVGFKGLSAAFAMAFAAGLCGIGQGKAIASACEGVARNPGAADKVQLMMIIGLAFIESLAIYALLVVFVKA